LRVSGTAELPHIDQGVGHQLHPKVPLLNVLKPKEEPLACILPRQGPIDMSPQHMDGGIESPLAPSFRALAGILCDMGDPAGMENTLAMVRGIKTCVKIELRPCQHHTCHVGHALQGFQSIR
jgi:hypothetical protein